MSTKKVKSNVTETAPVSQRLATYSALASAAMLASPAADAAVQIWNVGQTINPNAFFVTASFSAAFSIGFASSGTQASPADRYFWGANNNLSFINRTGPNNPARLGNGILVGSAIPGSQGGSWSRAVSSQTTSHDIQGAWTPGDQGYMGIRFGSGSQYYYGWVDMTMAGDGLVTVNRWALENEPDVPVPTPGAVPEPGTGSLLGLLALGAAGLRRRRASAAAA